MMTSIVSFLPLIMFIVVTVVVVGALKRFVGGRGKAQEIAGMLGLEYEGGVQLIERYAKDPQAFEAEQPSIGRLYNSEAASSHDIEKIKRTLQNNALFKFIDALLPWRMTGRYNGLEVCIQKMLPNNRSQRGGVRFEVFFRSEHPFSAEICTESLFAKFGKTFGSLQDIQTNNPELDKLVLIKGTPTEEVRGWLMDPGRHVAIIELFKAYKNAEISEKGVAVDIPKCRMNLETFRNAIDKMSIAASRLSH